jgi:2,6-dihydroxypseudooxynicotine hydrolase
LQATAEYYLARGLATIAIDGPGQGESEYELPIEPAYEKVATAAVDYLRTREDVDAARIGLFGVSLGGYYAARAAAYERRLKAVVALAGPYRFDLDWDELPVQTRETFKVRSHAASDDEARAKAAELTLEEAASAAPGIGSCPLTTRNASRRRRPRPSLPCTRTAATASPTAPTNPGPGWPTGWSTT